LGGQVPGLGQPRQHVVGAVVVQRHPARGGGVGLGGRHAQRGAYLLKVKSRSGWNSVRTAAKRLRPGLMLTLPGIRQLRTGLMAPRVGVAGLGKGALGGAGHGHRHLLTQHPRPLVVAG
jgi:hypothetical protein